MHGEAPALRTEQITKRARRMENVTEMKAPPPLPPYLQYALGFFGFPLWKTTDS